MIKSRFGAKPHIMMLFFALLTNLVIAGMVMSEGSIMMAILTDGMPIPYPRFNTERCVKTASWLFKMIS